MFYTHSLRLLGFFYFSRFFFYECPLDVSVSYFLHIFFLPLPPSIIWSVSTTSIAVFAWMASTCDIQVMSLLHTTFILRSLQCIWRDHLRGKTQCFFLSLAISSLKKQNQTNKTWNLFQSPTQFTSQGFSYYLYVISLDYSHTDPKYCHILSILLLNVIFLHLLPQHECTIRPLVCYPV